ncbi:hypothetical protein VE04_08857 [Pseudogymnoascus sp. 24MN13]|nr:hypothetical protein VE04_08857 [Pseudogymnoascus sp. 24MN13]
MIGIVNVLLSFENLVDDDLCVPLYLDTNFNVVITSKLHQGQGYERIILMALVSYVGSVEGAIFEEIMPGYDKDDDAEDFREISMLFGAKLKKENMDRRGEYETMGFRQIYEENNLGETTFRIVRGYVRLGKEENCHHAQKAELQAQKLAATEARKLSQAQNRARKLAATEARKLSQARNRARNQLKQAGIKARKQEQARKKSLAQLIELGLLIPPELEDPITDPEAEPESQYESASEGGSGRGSESGNEEVIIL